MALTELAGFSTRKLNCLCLLIPSRFEAVDAHPERWDTLMFTGGPVWAMEWCPSPDGSSDNQYVALACHRGMDDQHCANEKYTGSSLIQLWDVGKLEYDKR